MLNYSSSMPSARSRVVNQLTRVGTRVAYRKPKGIPSMRESFDRRDAKGVKPLPVGFTMEEVVVPVPGRWLRNAAASSGRTVLYLHGGAFVLRLRNSHTAFAASLADAVGASVFLPWYRLAPEDPFPAAPDDCRAAYRHLLDSGTSAEDVIVMGDSAGGNLALSLLHLIKRDGLPVPGAVVAFSPITDFAQISATWRLNKWRDPMYVVQGAVVPQVHYLQGASPVDPVASPYYGDLSGLPPVLVLVGGVEAMTDDAVSYVKKAVEAGVDATVQIWAGMPHVFLLYAFLPETADARAEVARWVLDTLDGPRRQSQGDCFEYRSRVQVFDRASFTGRMRVETNDVYLAD
jgi:acetyl esterase/lipase